MTQSLPLVIPLLYNSVYIMYMHEFLYARVCAHVCVCVCAVHYHL